MKITSSCLIVQLKMQLQKTVLLKLRRRMHHPSIHLDYYWLHCFVLLPATAAIQVRNLLNNKRVKKACSIAVCVNLRLVEAFLELVKTYTSIQKYFRH